MTSSRTPEIGDPILYHDDRSTLPDPEPGDIGGADPGGSAPQAPPDPNPAPGVIDAVYDGDVIDCTITLADGTTRQELAVPFPGDPRMGYPRFWEPAS